MITKTHSHFLALAAAFAALLAAPAATRAQNAYVWTGGAGNWSSDPLWTIFAPLGSDADVYIDGGKAGVLSAVTLDASYGIGRLTIDFGDKLILADSTGFTINAGTFSGDGSIVNNGNITFASTGNYVDLILAGDVTLASTGTGHGTITLDGSGYDRISGFGRLTIGDRETIQGGGNVGYLQSTILNNGRFVANTASATLILQPGGGAADPVGFTNTATGILVATADSTLKISGGRFTNYGSISGGPTSPVQLADGVTVVGGKLADVGSAIHSVSSTLDGVTNNSSLILDIGSNTTLVHTFTNNGTVTFTGSGSYLDLAIVGDVTLGGTGTTILGNSGFDRIYSAPFGDRVTIGTGQTVQGTGNIGSYRTNLTNNGTVLANQPANPLVIQPGAGDFTNSATGVVRATGGGTLQFSGGFLTNNGSIQSSAGSLVQLTDYVTVLGGKLADAGHAIHNVASTLNGVASPVTNNGSLILDGGITLMGTLTNNGTVTFVGTGTYLDLAIVGDATLGGTGTTTLSNSGFDRIYSAPFGDRLTIGAGQTIQGTGDLGLGRTNITNNGRITATNASNPLVLNPGAGDLTNNVGGWLHATGGGTLLMSSGVLTNNGLVTADRGTVTLDGTVTNYDAANTTLNGGSWSLYSLFNGNGATLNGSGIGPITINNADIVLSDANSSFPALDGLTENRRGLQINGGRNFTVVPGSFWNRGGMGLGVGTFTTDLFLNDGQLGLAGAHIVAVGGVQVSGAHRLSGFGTITGNLTNAGTVVFYLGGPTTVNGNVTNVDVNSVITVKDFPATFTGTVTNNGTFQTSHTTVTYGGTFANNYSYTSDTATQNFTNLVIAPTGSLTAVAGDVFNVTGNITNNSTQSATFNVSQAKFIMQGAGSHQFIWPGSTGAGTNSFAIGTLEVKSGETVTITTSGPGSGIVMGALIIGDGAEVTFGDGTPGLAAGGAGECEAGFSTPDGSQSVGVGSVGNLAPPATVPEPGTMGLLALGAIGGGIVGRRNRMRGGR